MNIMHGRSRFFIIEADLSQRAKTSSLGPSRSRLQIFSVARMHSAGRSFAMVVRLCEETTRSRTTSIPVSYWQFFCARVKTNYCSSIEKSMLRACLGLGTLTHPPLEVFLLSRSGVCQSHVCWALFLQGKRHIVLFRAPMKKV